MLKPRRQVSKALGVLACAALAVGGVQAGVATADTAPAENLPATASADLLPTPQINGVVWDQEIAGGKVFAGGKFTSARPFRVPAGQGEQARANLLSYDLESGKLTNFAPKLNGQVRAITASPDGKTVYIGGEFTSVDGKKRYRLAAFDTATGKLVPSFKPILDYRVNTIVVSGGTVYVGGQFSSAGKQLRSNLAAFNAKTGAVQAWAPKVLGGQVLGMTMSPDASKIIIGGQFKALNGKRSHGWGAVSPATGKSMPWKGTQWLQASGEKMGIYSVTSDAKHVYVTAFSDGKDNFEGIAAANWNDGSPAWVLDCHGDSYDSAPAGGVVYWASHAHSCESIGHKPETKPHSYMRANAVSAAASRSLKNTSGAYRGVSAPDLLHWYPKVDAGNFTGQLQGAWTVESNGKYVVLGGEFPSVNGKKQYGLARFAVKDAAPNKMGPVAPGNQVETKIVERAGGVVAAVKPVWDRDNEMLTYQLVRSGKVVDEKTVSSIWFRNEPIQLVDKERPAKGQFGYLVLVKDAMNNRLTSQVTLIGEGKLVKPGDPQPGDGDTVQPGDPNPGDGGGDDQPADPNPGDGGGDDQPADPNPGDGGGDDQPIDPNPGGGNDQPGRPGGSFLGGIFDGVFGFFGDLIKGGLSLFSWIPGLGNIANMF